MDYPLMKTVIKSKKNKKRFKFYQDHQFKENFEKWVFIDEIHFGLKMSEKRDGL